MKRFYFVLCIIMVLFLLFPYPAYAAKTRIRKPRATKSNVSYSTAQVSPNTHSIKLSFMNLGNVKSITYELVYASRDVPQGTMGTITITGQTTDSRDLYFGTCSHGVCTPHYGLDPKAGLMVCATMKNNTEWCKQYNISTKRLQ